MKIGDLAKKSGLSVRALHHYDEIGLLTPSMRVESGHRSYSQQDVSKLQKIISLKALGLSLDEIKFALAEREITVLRITVQHIDILEEELEAKQRLVERLKLTSKILREQGQIGLDESLETVNLIQKAEARLSYSEIAEVWENKKTLSGERRRKGIRPQDYVLGKSNHR